MTIDNSRCFISKKLWRLIGLLLLILPQLSFVSETNTKKEQTVRGISSTVEKENQAGISMDFNDADIAVLIKFISEITGKNFIVDNNVRGKVTIISPTKVTVDEAYRLFESVLETHGFTTVESGSVIKIIPASEARSKNVETISQ